MAATLGRKLETSVTRAANGKKNHNIRVASHRKGPKTGILVIFR